MAVFLRPHPKYATMKPMIKTALLSLALLAFLPALAIANDDLKMKDSVYYTWDDGIMTPDEMEMEANDVYRLCEANVSQKNLFKCGCLAGAFLQQREKYGPTMPQHKILRELTITNPVPSCANTDMVAGDSYTACMSQMAPLRPLVTDNEEYCVCVANKVAKDFAKAPVMSPAYVREMSYNSMIFCNDPQNRPAKSAAKTAN